MNVINWLLANNMDWDKLKEEFGIKVKHYPEQDLHVLNYDQIGSPKMHPIVRECRGLVLDYDLNVVARPFDRFFNRGEADTDQYEGMVLNWFEKLDGSFIKVYMHQGRWHIGTRGTAFAESEVNGFSITFEQLALKALNAESMDHFQQICKWACMFPEVTYMFELTAIENRVVTRYHEPRIGALAARNNLTGDYLPRDHLKRLKPFCDVLEGFVGTAEEMTLRANSLTGLKEGFVGYLDGKPVVKVKSEAYVAVHHLRGEGLNPKRVSELVATGEEDEYLAYFPEDKAVIQPFINAKEEMLLEMGYNYQKSQHIRDQKDFALSVKGFFGHSLMFMARRNSTTIENVYSDMDVNSKARMIRSYMEGK